MTVAQNVEYGLKVRGVPRDERRTRTSDALDMVRLSGEASRKPAQLSGGQRQRVALARALVGRPRVLLLDEPLGALDLKLREQMQIELKEIQREVGITFVIVTHDQDEALTLCDRLAVFNEGRIEQVGEARDVYESPANRFVADFVGTSNVLDGSAAEALVGRPGPSSCDPNASRSSRREPTRARRSNRGSDGLGGHLRRAHHEDRRGHCTRGRADRHRPDGQHLAAADLTTAPQSPWRGRKKPFTTCQSRSNDETICRPTGLVLGACAALVVACSSSEESGETAEAPPKLEPMRPSATARANSISSRGPATPRTAPTTRRSTG